MDTHLHILRTLRAQTGTSVPYVAVVVLHSGATARIPLLGPSGAAPPRASARVDLYLEQAPEADSEAAGGASSPIHPQRLEARNVVYHLPSFVLAQDDSVVTGFSDTSMVVVCGDPIM